MREEIKKTDAEIEADFLSLGVQVKAGSLIYTRDTIESFAEARKNWARPGRVEVYDGRALVIADCIAVPNSVARWVAIIDYGTVRAAALR